MISLLWLIPALPFASALVLMLFGSRFSRRATAAVGVGSIGLSALIAILVAVSFFTAPPPGSSYTQVLWTWINVAGFEPQIGLYLDALSLVMVLVVTFVGFLIHIYSAEFMIEDEGYSRFFAYMNLFVASMITLLLGEQPSASLSRVGRRGVVQLSADWLLVPRSRERPGGAQGIYRNPRGRYRDDRWVCFCCSPSWARCRFRI